ISRPRPRVPGGRPVCGQQQQQQKQQQLVAQNQQATVTSCGVAALDVLIGGGLAVGGLCVVDEDATGAYAGVLTRYFLAQSLLDGHHVMLVAANQAHSEYLLANLPDLEEGTKSQQQQQQQPAGGIGDSGAGNDDGLAIAWRYMNAPQFEERHSLDKSTTGAKSFDLSKKLDLTKLEEAGSLRLNVLHLDEFGSFPANASLALDQIRQRLVDGGPEFRYPDRPTEDTQSLLKVVIPGFASPLWGRLDNESDALRCLYSLRDLCAKHLCTVWLTVPDCLRLQRPILSDRMRHLVDYCLRLDSLQVAGGRRRAANPLYRDLHGLLSLAKLPCLPGSAAPVARPDTLEFGFRVRRKNFLIQRLHLPPDISETASRVSKSVPQPTCGTSAQGTPLDF
ncbi:hypothetical protein BOX15_Mlig018002g1, partial [Macrostomum lignano]